MPLRQFWESLFAPKKSFKKRRTTRLGVEMLEERCTPANASGLLGGTAFIDANSNGLFDGNDAALPGVTVTLTGTTTTSNPVNATVVTDGNGAFNFLNVLPGTYNLTAGSVQGFNLTGSIGGVTTPNGVTIASNVALGGGQTLNSNSAGLRGGIAAPFVSIRQFLTTTTIADYPYARAGSGQTLVNFRANDAPTVKGGGINSQTLATSSSKTIDLAGFFNDTDFTNSQVTLNVTNGTVQSQIKLTLLDTQAPQTVSNFFNYVLAGEYDNSIFHRLSAVANGGLGVLQGGGLKLANAAGTNLVDVPSVGFVPNEFQASNANVANTIAMARPSTTNPADGLNLASNQFFFNTVDNSAALDPQKFTVFGRITDFSSQLALSTLTQTQTHDLDGLTPNTDTTPSAVQAAHPSTGLGSVPLTGYSGNETTFAGDAVAANYMRITSVNIDKRDEFLNFTAVSDNTSVVAIVPNAGHSDMLTFASSGAVGTANITVTATDRFGASIQATFTVTVTA